MNRRWGAAAPLLVVCASLSQACGLGEDKPANEQSRNHALIGGDSTIATYSTAMPTRAVGRVDRDGGGSCTATAISRNVVLFAAHCLCNDIRIGSGVGGTSLGANWAFHLPYAKDGKLLEAGPDPSLEYAPFAGGIRGIGAVAYHIHPKKCDPDLDSRPLSAARYDLAIMVLARPLSVVELPQPLDVYTSGDLVDRIFNLSKSPTYDPSFWSGPLNLVGWAGTNVKRFGSLLGDQKLEFISGGPYYIKIKQGDSADTTIQNGDSGGPVTFMRNGTTPTEFGVAATMLDYPSGDDYVLFSPTFDTGYGNGEFVRTFLEDGDRDGVLDSVDNCAPSRCKYPEKCANVDQADADGDGVGDACDNCAPSRCIDRGLPGAACWNDAQLDTDGDGVGEICDNCPDTTDSSQYDPDGDGVGICDNCPYVANPFRACSADTDCVERRPDGTATGVTARCIVPPGQPGRCSKQLDDWDRDVVGAACDSCPSVANATVQANSNPSRESNLGAAPLGDRCDPVPLYVTRPVIATAPLPAKTITHLAGSAGIGSATDAPSKSFNGRVAFRHCDCLTAAGEIIEEAACRASGNCATDPHTMTSDSWTPVTVGTSTSTVPAPGEPLSRVFRDTVDCTDTLLHPTPDATSNPEGVSDEPCRVGSVESVFWFHDVDVKAGRVRSYGTSSAITGTKTVGLLSSQVLVDAVEVNGVPVFDSYASTRDQASLGALRFNFQYVKTPLYNEALGKVALTLPADWFDRIGIFRPGDNDPFRDPEGGPFDFLRAPVGVVSTPGGVFALSSADGTGVDVTSSVSQTVRAAFGTPGISWVSAVESFAAAPSPIAMVGLPTSWQQSFGAPLVVARSRGGLHLTTELQGQNIQGSLRQSFTSLSSGPFLPTPNDAPIPLDSNGEVARFVPGDRSGARAIYSSTRRSIFMIGGLRGGSPTGEVWQYAIDDGSWRRLFATGRLANAAAMTGERADVGNVLAASYDTESDRMIALDDVTREGSEKANALGTLKQVVRRLVVLDRRTDSVRAIPLGQKAKQLSRFGIAARADGTFVVVAQRTNTPHWMAFRLALGANGPTWTIIARGQGTVVDGTYATPQGGVVVPIATGQGAGLSFANLTPAQCAAPAVDNLADEPNLD